MRRFAIVPVLAILIAGAGCSRNGVPTGQAVVDVQKGSRVLIGERDQGLRPVEGRRTVHLGAQVKVLAGSATIALDDGGRLDVRRGSEVELGSPISLVAEDLLVTSGDRPVAVAVAGSKVTVDGVARLTRDLAVSAATYRGKVIVRSAARSLAVPALRQAEVPSLGVLPAAPDPLEYDDSDIWDRRFLGAAMELTEQLQSRSDGFSKQLEPGEGHTPGFYRVLIPALEREPAFGEDLVSETLEPGDTLVGAAIAVTGRIGSFVERWDAVFGFHNQGATWGLVALDQQVNDANALVQTVDLAIGNQSFAFAPTPTVALVSNAPGPLPVAPEPARPANAPPVASARPPASPPAAAPPADTPLLSLPELPTLIPPPSPDSPGILAPLLDVVTDTLGGLLNPSP